MDLRDARVTQRPLKSLFVFQHERNKHGAAYASTHGSDSRMRDACTVTLRESLRGAESVPGGQSLCSLSGSDGGRRGLSQAHVGVAGQGRDVTTWLVHAREDLHRARISIRKCGGASTSSLARPREMKARNAGNEIFPAFLRKPV